MPDLSRFTALAAKAEPVPGQVKAIPKGICSTDALRPTQELDVYEERAAIMEFEAGLPRREAERRAWAETMIEFK